MAAPTQNTGTLSSILSARRLPQLSPQTQPNRLETKLPLSMFPDFVFSSKKKGSVGRKKKYDRQVLADLTVNVPWNERGTFHSHAAQIGVSAMTSWRLCQTEDFGVIHSSLKPTLTEENMNQRVQYCL